MAGWLKSLGKDTLVYGVGYGVSRFLHIIILPIITQALTLGEFGYYSNYVIFYTVAAGFFVLGLDSAVARYYYDSEDRRYHESLFSTAFFFILALSGIFTGIAFLFPDRLQTLLDVPAAYQEALYYVLMSIPVITLNNFFLSWFKWKRQRTYFLFNSGGSVVALLIPLVLAVKVSFVYVFQVIFWGQLVIALLSGFFARDYIRPRFNPTLLRSLLVYGFPWMLVFIFGISRTYIDRVFLTGYLSDEVYGMYNFSVRVASLVSLVVTAFDMAFGPLAFSIWNKEGAPRFFARLQSGYVFVISAIACAIAICSPMLVLLLGGEKYAGTENILPYLLFAAIPLSLIHFSNLGTVYAKKSFLSTLSLFIGFIAVLAGNFILTPVYLQYGAAISSLLGHLLILVVGYYFSRKYYRIPFTYIKDGCIFLGFFLLSVLAVEVPFGTGRFNGMLAQLLLLMLVMMLGGYVLFRREYQKGISWLRNKRAFFCLLLLLLGVSGCGKKDAFIYEPWDDTGTRVPVVRHGSPYLVTYPASGDSLVFPTAKITVRGNDDLNVGGVFISDVKVWQGSVAVTGIIKRQYGSIIFAPDQDLLPYTTYKVEARARVRIPGGDYEMPERTEWIDEEWEFTTGITKYAVERRSQAVTDFARDGNKMVQVGEYLYSYGGWVGGDMSSVSHNDIYRSSGDLTVWERLPDAPWDGRHTFGIGKIGSAVYIYGGDQNFREFDVWKTEDGAGFTEVAPEAEFPVEPRLLYGATAHNNRLYLMGGQSDLDESATGFTDVWRSRNGAFWEKISDGHDFLGKNISGAVASFNGRIWVVGGGGYRDPDPEARWTNHMYSSPDGIDWRREPDAPWDGRQYGDVCVWDEKLWVIGGHNGQNLSEVWYLARSGEWAQVQTPPEFVARHASAVAVYNDQLVITCGDLHNDCWVIGRDISSGAEEG